MRRTMMTSLVTIGGIALALMQVMRMRNNKSSALRNSTQWLNQMMNGLMRETNQMARTVRRRVRS
jgi:Tfp pilus assembly protein PilV